MTKKIYFGLIINFFLLASFLSFAAAPEVSAQNKKQLDRAKKIAAEGDKLFRQKNYQGAIDKYAEAIVVAPKYPYAHFWKGYAHYYLNQYDQAAEELNLADQQGFTPKLEIYKLRWYLNYLTRNYDAALTDVQEGLRLEPSSAYLTLALGDVYRAKEMWREALTAYQSAARLDQNNADLYYLTALSHFHLNETDAQAIAASEAIKRGTKFMGESYFLAGDALQKSKRIDAAVDAYERALNVKPQVYEVYGLLSDIYRSQNRFPEAISLAKKGLELYPDDANLYISLAWYYSLADKHREAVEAGERAIQLAPNQHMAFTNLCRAYNDTKQYQKAIDTCNKAHKLTPGDGETFFYLGRAYDFLNQPDKATQAYDKAVVGLVEFTRNNPDYSDGFYLLGNAYFADQQRDKAIEAYKKALQISPRFAKARYNLGYIYFLNNNLTAAREQYEELRKIDAVTAERLKQAMEKK